MKTFLPVKLARLSSLLSLTALLAFGLPRESAASSNPYLDAVQKALDPTNAILVSTADLSAVETALNTVLAQGTNKTNANLYLSAVLSQRVANQGVEATALLQAVVTDLQALTPKPTLVQIAGITGSAIAATGSTTWPALVNTGITVSGTSLSLSSTTVRTTFTANVVAGLTNAQAVSSVVQSAFYSGTSTFTGFAKPDDFAKAVASNTLVSSNTNRLTGAILGGETLLSGTATSQSALAIWAIKTFEAAPGNLLAANIIANLPQLTVSLADEESIINSLATSGTGRIDAVNLEILTAASKVLPSISGSDTALGTVFQTIVGLTATSKAAAAKTLATVLAARPTTQDADIVSLLPYALTGIGSSPTPAAVALITGTALSFTSGTSATAALAISKAETFVSGSNTVSFTANLVNGLTDRNKVSFDVQNAFLSATSGTLGSLAFTQAVASNTLVSSNTNRLTGAILAGETLLSGTATSQSALAIWAIKTFEAAPGNLLAANIIASLPQTAISLADGESIITNLATSGTARVDAVNLEILTAAAKILPSISGSDTILGSVLQTIVGLTATSKAAAAKTLATVLAARPTTQDADIVSLLPYALTGIGASATPASVALITGTALSFTSGTSATAASAINKAEAFVTGSANTVAFTANLVNSLTDRNKVNFFVQNAFLSSSSVGLGSLGFTQAVASNTLVSSNTNRLTGAILAGETLLSGTATSQSALAIWAIKTFEAAPGNLLAANIIASLPQTAASLADGESVITNLATSGTARIDAVNLEILTAAARILPSISGSDTILGSVFQTIVGLTATSKASAAKTLATILAVRPAATQDADVASLLPYALTGIGSFPTPAAVALITGTALSFTSGTSATAALAISKAETFVSGSNIVSFTANLVNGFTDRNKVSFDVQNAFLSATSGTLGSLAFTQAVASNTLVSSNTNRLTGAILAGETLLSGTATSQSALAIWAIKTFEAAPGNLLAYNLITNLPQTAASLADQETIITTLAASGTNTGRTDAINLEILTGAARVLPALTAPGSGETTLGDVFQKIVGLTATSRASVATTLSTILAARPTAIRDADAALLLPYAVKAVSSPLTPLTATNLYKITDGALTSTSTAGVQQVIATAMLSVNSGTLLLTSTGQNQFTTNVLTGLTNVSLASNVVQGVYNSGSSVLGTSPSTFALGIATLLKTNAPLSAGAISGGIALLSGSTSAQTDLARNAILTLNGATASNIFAYNLALYSTPLFGASTSGTAYIYTLANSQTELIKDQIAKGAVQAVAGSSSTARALVSAVMNSTGTIVNYATFASTALSGALTNSNIGNVATTIAEVVSTAYLSGTAQSAFAKSLAALQPTLAASIAKGVAFTNPSIVPQITNQVVTANATTISNAPGIASSMTNMCDLAVASYIATEIGKSFATTPTLAALAPKISGSMTATLYAKLDSSTNSQTMGAQEIAATAFALASGLSTPGSVISAANQTAIKAIATNLASLLNANVGNSNSASFNHQVSIDFYAALANSYYTQNSAFVGTTLAGIFQLLPMGTYQPLFTTEIAQANAKTYAGVWGPLQFPQASGIITTPETPVN